MASSAPSWQVDIPGLSQLVFNVGAHGLKQLASAGVDIHTVGCMLMVSELVPACPEFRKSLNAARRKQRNEKTWLYNLVEIGASTSFLVEQFLKTRAGENVLALMTAIAPLMSPEACPLLLNHLFEDSKIAPENTPGMQQFAKLRDGLIDFTRLVGFREKVMHQYDFLLRLAKQGSHFSHSGDIAPYDAIPNVASLSKIVRACHAIAAAEDGCILYVKGFTGSAWIASYASHILKLPTCAIDGRGRRIPMTDHYDKAKVVICPYDEETKLEFYTIDTLTEVIVLARLDRGHCRGWSVSCDNFNYLEFRHPEISSLRVKQSISSFVANLALNKAASMASRPGNRFANTIPYFLSMLPQIRQRCLENLSTLGFSLLQHERYDIDTDDYKNIRKIESPLSLSPSESDADQQTPFSKQSMELFALYIQECAGSDLIGTTITDEDSAVLKAAFFGTLRNSILLASHLAFTDWSATLRSLSSRFLWRRIDLAVLSQHSIEVSPVEHLALGAVFDSEDFDKREWKPDMIALDVDHVIIIRTFALRVTLLDSHGIVLSLVPGMLVYQDQPRQIIVCGNIDPYIRDIPGSEPYKPRDIVPNLRSRHLIHATGDTLYLKHEIFDGQDLLGTALPRFMTDRLMGATYITTPCDCDYYKPFNRESLRLPWAFLPGFSVNKPNTFFGALQIYYQMVENNSLGQWCAAQIVRDSRKYITILQRGACLDCIFSWLGVLKVSPTEDQPWGNGTVVIVPIGED